MTISSLSGYELWASTRSEVGLSSEDADLDGTTNLVEYAFDTNPEAHTSHATLPQAMRNGNNLGFSYTPPSDRDDVVYGAEWSNNFTIGLPSLIRAVAGPSDFPSAPLASPRSFCGTEFLYSFEWIAGFVPNRL